MSQVKKGWKIVTAVKDDDRYFQSFAIWLPGWIIYRYDEWVKPRDLHGPLSVFKTKEAAHEFLSGLSKGATHSKMIRQLIRCEYKPSRTVMLYYPTHFGRRTTYIKELCPDGTAFASAVRLIKS